jgi:hypothetical protein
MKKTGEKEQLFQVGCPCCQSILWIDSVTKEVIQYEKKGAKKKESLEELLLKEKKRIGEFERKFEATAELEKKRKERAEEGFKKALIEADEE